jgi:hypothetical protein
MKRRSIEDYQKERREREAHTTPGDEERKERVLARGRECLRRIQGDVTWEDWMGAGAALMVITEEAMAEVGATVWDANNRRLTREFTQRWDEYETSALEAGSNQKPLSKQERWALREVMTNPAIGMWRSGLDGTNRRKLNHPNKVIERWRRATQTSDKEPRKPSPSLSQALKERDKTIAELQARSQELEEEREGRGVVGTLDEAIEAVVRFAADMPVEEKLKLAVRIADRLGIETQSKRVRRKVKKGPKVITRIAGIGDVVMED